MGRLVQLPATPQRLRQHLPAVRPPVNAQIQRGRVPIICGSLVTGTPGISPGRNLKVESGLEGMTTGDWTRGSVMNRPKAA